MISKRTLLGGSTLNNVLILNVEKLLLQDFSSDAAIGLWSGHKFKKPSRCPWKWYKKHTQQSDTQTSDTDNDEEEDEEEKLLVAAQWDEYLWKLQRV